MSQIIDKEELHFRDWMAEVSEELIGLCGLSLEDLPDYGYRDAFESGSTPEQVAQEVLEENGGLDFP